MSLLVTGHRGFVGGYLKDGQNTVGLNSENGEAVDLLDKSLLVNVLARIKPTEVLHMAAQSAVPASFKDPVATYNANFIGTQNLLSALKETHFSGRFLFVSSAEVYGAPVETCLPVAETAAAAPLNPYAVSKLAAEALCSYFSRVEGIDVVIARPFNHIGPGQSPRFAIADFAKAIVEIKLGLRPPLLMVGDLNVTRDFTDVRDVVAAYRLLLKHGEAGEIYNVCSGVEQRMSEAVETLCQLANVDVKVEVSADRLRKASQRRSCGNNSKLRGATNWVPQVQWRHSLRDILIDWENKLK